MISACPACNAAPLAQQTALRPNLQFSVPSVHCAACIGKIERGLQTVPGLRKARVNLSSKRLSIEGNADPTKVLAKLEKLGFEAYPLDLDAIGQAETDHSRALLTRLAVAGFAMMNVMLLSVAIWSGATDATRDLFHLVSAIIALPVVAYSGQPFFQNAWTALRVRRLNMDVPISLAILLAAGMSLFETLNGGAHAYFDAALSLTFFLLVGRYMDLRTRHAARSAAKELSALEVQTATRVTPTGTQTVKATDLQIGDIVLVPSGARVPVDGTLLSPSAWMDRALLTGESAPVAIVATADVKAGEINQSNPIEIKATAVGEDTSLRRMAAMIETAENGRNTYTALADKAAQIYAPAVHMLALAAFLGWLMATSDVRLSLNIAIAVLIITCPCALGLAVPAVSTAAISRLFNAGFLVKHATALERLAEVDQIVLDKTGTLTRPAVVLPDGMNRQEKAVLKAMAQASDHPLSRAIANALQNVPPAELSAIAEVPGHGVEATFDGSPGKLGRGAWLGSSFAGLGCKFGTKPAQEIPVTEALRTGVKSALQELDLPARMITGDSEQAAKAVAAPLGLEYHAGTRPEDKVQHLIRMERDGHHVLMIGDGLNDTAALASAHASIAPATALDASRSAADVVALRESFADLPLVLRVARFAVKLSKQNFAIAALYNCIAVPIALAGLATPLAAALAMSASSITVLLNSGRIRMVK